MQPWSRDALCITCANRRDGVLCASCERRRRAVAALDEAMRDAERVTKACAEAMAMARDALVRG